MSDIGAPDGLLAIVVALATVAGGALGGAVMLLAALVSRLPSGDRRQARALRFTAGPLACAAFGVACAIFVKGVGPPTSQWLDTLSPLIPLAGLGAWVALALALRRRPLP